jgi:hypothetical protein
LAKKVQIFPFIYKKKGKLRNQVSIWDHLSCRKCVNFRPSPPCFDWASSCLAWKESSKAEMVKGDLFLTEESCCSWAA